MRQIIIYSLLPVLIFTGCEKKENTISLDTGIVTDFAGLGNCGVVIDLDNGKQIQPLFYPDNFIFAEGQRIIVEYREIPDVIPACDKGSAAEILYIEELGCAPLTDLYPYNYDSLANDPVFINEAYIEGECMHLKISYPGGCREHGIDLARIHADADKNSITLLEIRHDSKGDMCEAFITKEYCFDLSGLKIEGIDEFRLSARLNDEDDYNQIFTLD
ncbi:MAG: NigD-like C-terminal domain-containing protein [Prolixibacteraceae bacterium]|nr:NigD-like C-terminal domain-containing protein [Prolixibacteraceae bacterium]